MYLFVSPSLLRALSVVQVGQGGRLVTERRMTSDLYMFDLETFEWEYIQPSSEDDIPRPRYFHSTDTCKLLRPEASPATKLP